MEICIDAFGGGSDGFHVVFCGGLELRLGSHGGLCADGSFEVGVQPLIRVQLRRRARQIEGLNRINALGDSAKSLIIRGTRVKRNRLEGKTTVSGPSPKKV